MQDIPVLVILVTIESAPGVEGLLGGRQHDYDHVLLMTTLDTAQSRESG